MKRNVRGVGAKVSVGRFLAIAVAAGAVAVSVLPAASASAATRTPRPAWITARRDYTDRWLGP